MVTLEDSWLLRWSPALAREHSNGLLGPAVTIEWQLLGIWPPFTSNHPLYNMITDYLSDVVINTRTSLVNTIIQPLGWVHTTYFWSYMVLTRTHIVKGYACSNWHDIATSSISNLVLSISPLIHILKKIVQHQSPLVESNPKLKGGTTTVLGARLPARHGRHLRRSSRLSPAVWPWSRWPWSSDGELMVSWWLVDVDSWYLPSGC